MKWSSRVPDVRRGRGPPLLCSTCPTPVRCDHKAALNTVVVSSVVPPSPPSPWSGSVSSIRRIACAPSEALLESLLGARDEYLVTTCLGHEARCDGALVRSDWVVVEYSCLAPHEFTPMKYVILGKHNCSMEAVTSGFTEQGVSLSRTVVRTFPGEMETYMNLALLKLDRPYELQYYNRSHDSETLDKFSRWFEVYMYMSTIQTTSNDMSHVTIHHVRPVPFKVFLLTVILPMVAFAAFFVYIIFYTGSTEESKISYKTLNNEKKEHPV
ncbi:unnamed protein product [Danaus chrysippus]|uniref:(African queen) hypothetical protein n=1 Tax=Danaus chrysippus TaxID=151541 RepID=A0A8J2WAN5_9NEOP|nr:unnamed protein product [Danaus chrysippus]